MQKAINIYRDSDGKLSCTFWPLRPEEKVLRTVVVNEAYMKQIKTDTIDRVRDLLEYFISEN